MRSRTRRPNYEPTEHDIELACERIQQSWSERERLKREGKADSHSWLPPTIEISALTLDDSWRAAS